MKPAREQLLLAKSLSEVKKDAWKLFSELIRRDQADKDGLVKCCSCGKIVHWKQSQAGHWPSIAGRTNAVLFARKGVHPQCGQCNVYKDGNPAGYNEYMEENYTKKERDELLKLKRTQVHYEKIDLIKMMDRWLAELEKLDKIAGI